MPTTNLVDLLAKVLDGMPDAVVVADECGTIVWVNSQVEPLFGYKPDELLGVSVEQLMTSRFRAGHVKHRAHFSSRSTPRPMGTGMPLQGRHKDGSKFPLGINLNPLHARDRYFVVCTIRDISDYRDISDWRDIKMHLNALAAETRTVFAAKGQPGTTTQPQVKMTPQHAKELSAREREILRFLAEGTANKGIAAHLGISIKTVETYRSRLLHKLNLDSLVGLVHYAIRNRIVTP